MKKKEKLKIATNLSKKQLTEYGMVSIGGTIFGDPTNVMGDTKSTSGAHNGQQDERTTGGSTSTNLAYSSDIRWEDGTRTYFYI